jgi:hypothetical protein
MEITNCDIHEIVLIVILNFKIMWIPISIDDYVQVHLKKNPNEKENVLKVRIEALENDSPRQGQKILEQGSALLNVPNS